MVNSDHFPTDKGFIMSTVPTITLALAKITGKQAGEAKATAEAMVAEYKANGLGSNRTNWSRLAEITARLAVVNGTGKAVEVTDLFTDTEAKAPAYNIAHRALSAGLVRPTWHTVRVIALAECKAGKGNTVTGISNTTARVGQVRLFYVPAN